MVAMNRPRRKLPLGKVYGLLEPGPVVLLATAHRGRFFASGREFRLPSRMK